MSSLQIEKINEDRIAAFPPILFVFFFGGRPAIQPLVLFSSLKKWQIFCPNLNYFKEIVETSLNYNKVI